MLKITKASGNIFDNKNLQKKFETLDKEGRCERLQVSRQELEKTRLRKNTDKGSDIGLSFSDGTRLHHGDVLITDDRFILVEQMREKVISINIKQDSKIEPLVLLGHIIGNRHRPISIDNQTISFPIQADSEFKLFKNLLSEIIENLEMKVEERVFVPHKGMDVHEH